MFTRADRELNPNITTFQLNDILLAVVYKECILKSLLRLKN